MAIAVLEPILARIVTFFGFAGAAREVVTPYTNELAQDIWASHPSKVLDPDLSARITAQGINLRHDWELDANRGGVDGDKFDALVKLYQGPPDIDTLTRLLHRELIDPPTFVYGLRRLGIEESFMGPVQKAAAARLSPADVANAVQQGFVPTKGLLPVAPPTAPGKVQSPDPVDIDPVREAEASGVDRERLEVMARLAGLPPGPQELLEMFRRGKITEADVLRGIAEGHTKTEWGEIYLEMVDRPLSAADLAMLVIKEWMPLDEAHKRARAAGVSTDTLDWLVKGHGRPPGPAQLQTALNRGLIDAERFRHGIAESDVRTEWVDVLHALRVRYPTAFALRQLLSSGAIPPAEGQRILELQGWETDLARKVSHAWADQQSARVKELAESQIAVLYEARFIDRGQAEAMLERLGYPAQARTYLLELADARRVTRFLNTAVSKLHALYTGHRAGEQETVTALHELGISSLAVDDLMATWKLERAANIPGVTPAEITSAVHYQIISRDEGIAMLVARGYTEHDARFKIAVREHSAAPGEAL